MKTTDNSEQIICRPKKENYGLKNKLKQIADKKTGGNLNHLIEQILLKAIK